MEKTVNVINGVNVEQKDNTITVKGEKGELKRKFEHPRVKIKINSVVHVETKSEKRKDKAIVGTWVSHLKNMMMGASKGYEYKLKIVYTHFPITVKVVDNHIEITNFMGEKGLRISKKKEGTEVNIENDEITVSGIDKEKVGQTAANLELACRKKGKDLRIFQDGIYITEKS